MQNVMNFNFRVTDTDYFSRVSEIRSAEQTMESLSDAIEVFAKFVPETVVRGIIQGKLESTRLHVESRVVTVAFSDIKGFTSISEKLPISDLLFFLTRYLTVMTEVIELYEGTVTEILGDGLLVLWNAPDSCVDHPSKACAAALAMQVAVHHIAQEFHLLFTKYSLDPLFIRVGLHTGKVLAGNIGSATKLKYGCLGDTINTASRLEGLCKLYGVGVLCSEDCYKLLAEQKFQCRELDIVQVKGKDNALAIYEVQSLIERISIGPLLSSIGTVGERPMPKSFSPQGTINFKNISKSAKSVWKGLGAAQVRKPSSSSAGRMSISSFGPIAPASSESLQGDARLRNEEYEKALKAFQAGDFKAAIEVLSHLEDNASKVLLLRAKQALDLVENGELSLEDWTGVNRLTEKY